MTHRTLSRALAAVALAAGLAAGAASARGAPQEPAMTPQAKAAQLARGHDLVLRNCSMCHAVGPSGASPNPASPPFRDLHRSYPIENLAEALAEGILTGHPSMPEFVFGPDDIQAIIGYLESIQTRQGAQRRPATPGG